MWVARGAGGVDAGAVTPQPEQTASTGQTEPDEPAGPDRRGLDVPAALRALRRRADLSQRELADRSGVPASTVASIESGGSGNPRVGTLERLVGAAGARLAIVDADGSEPARLTTDDWCDQAGRRFPPHLDPHRITWRGIGPVTGFAFIRHRQRRDWVRRWAAGERRRDVTREVRRLGPGDTATLAALGATPVSDAEALRYFRDPSVRHWVVEESGILDEWLRGRVIGHLVAHVHRRPGSPPVLVVTEGEVRPGRRDRLAGRLLVAAMSDEAARLGAGDIVAIPADRSASRRLRRLGFRRRWGFRNWWGFRQWSRPGAGSGKRAGGGKRAGRPPLLTFGG